MTRYSSRVAALALGIACAACTSMGRVDSGVSAPAGDHTYFVIGVQPQDVRVSIFKGGLEGGRFKQDLFAASSFLGAPEDGYILGETHGGNTLAITIVVPNTGPNKPFSQPFHPCGEAKTLVFTAPAGKVVYVGSVRYAMSTRGVHPSYGADFDGARAFVKAHYPALADRLEQGRADILPTAAAC